MEKVRKITSLVLKALALGMAAASIVIGALGGASADTLVTLLGIGLFALAVAALQDAEASAEDVG